MYKKALFLDRDGILIEDTAYPHKKEDLTIRLSIIPLLKKAQEKGYLLIIVTNQSGIARGYFTEDEYQQFHQWMLEEFAKYSIHFDGSYYCPFLKGAKIKKYDMDSSCRKPRPGMIEKAKYDFSLDLSKCLMIGDKESDLITLEGLSPYLIRGNYPLPDDHRVFSNEESLMKELKWL